MITKGQCNLKNPKRAVPDGEALSFARTQLGHNVSLLISLANEGGEVKGESSWIPVEHASSMHLEVIQS